MKRASTMTQQPRPSHPSEAQEPAAASATVDDPQPAGSQVAKAATPQKPSAFLAPKREDRGHKAEQRKAPKASVGNIVPMEFLLTQAQEADTNDT